MPKKKTLKSKKPNLISFSNKLTKLLDQAKVKYNLIEHKVVYTAHDVSTTTKKKLKEIAKVVLVKVTGTQPVIARSEATKQSKNRLPHSPKSSFAMTDYFVLIVLPAGKYLDLAGIKKALKAKKISIANEKDITEHLKTKVGLLHPFGIQYDLKTLLDKTLAKSKKLIASAGSYKHSVELAMKDFEKLVLPIKGAFSKNTRRA